MTDGLQLRRPLVGHRKVVVIDVLHVTNALRPVRRRSLHGEHSFRSQLARPPAARSESRVVQPVFFDERGAGVTNSAPKGA